MGDSDSTPPPQPQKDPFPNQFSMNCPVSATLSLVMGGGMGGLFGGVLGSYNGLTDPSFEGPWKQRLRHAGSLARVRGWSFMKGFGAFSVIYEASLCMIEKHRATTDIRNHIYAGCLTGGVLGVHAGGLSGACVGCIGMGAFSAVIETFLHAGN